MDSEVNMVYLHHNNRTMKEMITELTAAFKANPLEIIGMALTITGLFAAFYAIIWIGSAIGLQ